MVVVPLLFDPNEYRQEIMEQLRKQIGRNLVIEGGLRLEIFPLLVVHVGAISVGNAHGFDAKPAEIERAEVSIRLWPLLYQQIEISQVTIERLKLNLAKDNDGHANWEDMRGEDKDGQGMGNAQTTARRVCGTSRDNCLGGRYFWKRSNLPVAFAHYHALKACSACPVRIVNSS